jgi:hypothetical protein
MKRGKRREKREKRILLFPLPYASSFLYPLSSHKCGMQAHPTI